MADDGSLLDKEAEAAGTRPETLSPIFDPSTLRPEEDRIDRAQPPVISARGRKA